MAYRQEKKSSFVATVSLAPLSKLAAMKTIGLVTATLDWNPVVITEATPMSQETIQAIAAAKQRHPEIKSFVASHGISIRPGSTDNLPTNPSAKNYDLAKTQNIVDAVHTIDQFAQVYFNDSRIKGATPHPAATDVIHVSWSEVDAHRKEHKGGFSHEALQRVRNAFNALRGKDPKTFESLEKHYAPKRDDSRGK